MSVLKENTESPGRPETTSRRDRVAELPSLLLILAALLAFFGLALGLHHAGFHSPMVYDSVGFVAENTSTFARHDIRGVLGIVPARPLFMLTLYLNYLWAGMDPYFFRVINALILAASGVALALLSILICEIPTLGIPGTTGQKRVVGFLLGLWFVVHPLQSLVVLYIWQREAILACLFLFSATAAYIAGRSGRLAHPFISYIITSLLFLAGILSKENVIVLPAVLLLAELTLLRQDWRQIVARAGVIALITVPPLVASLLLIHNLHGPDATHGQGVWNRLDQYYRTSGLTVTEVMLTECRVFFSYVLAILAPFRSGVQLVAVETVSRSLVNPPQTLVAVAGVVAFVALGIGQVRKYPVMTFGILFFFITLLPESVLIPQYLFCGYRAVLPMAGILLVLGPFMLGAMALPKKRYAKTITAALVLTMIGISAWMTVAQARRWTPLEVWQGAYRRLPPFSANVEVTPYLDILGSLGTELSNAGRYDEAIHVLGQVASINSEANNFKKTLALVTMGLAQTRKGDVSDGIESFKRAVQCDPSDPWPRYNLGVALAERGDTAAGLASLRKAVELNPRDPAVRLSLGKVLMQTGHAGEAVDHYREAARLDPVSAPTRTSLAVALEKSGNLPLAVAAYRKAVELAPGSAESHFNLAKSLAQMGNVSEAIAGYQRAVELNPSFGPSHANLGTLLLRTGRMREAALSLQTALGLLPANAELTYQYGLALQALGRNPDAGEQFRKALAIQPSHLGARKALDMGGPSQE